MSNKALSETATTTMRTKQQEEQENSHRNASFEEWEEEDHYGDGDGVDDDDSDDDGIAFGSSMIPPPVGQQQQQQQSKSETNLQQQQQGRIQLSEEAPDVDLNLYVVENKGLMIAENPNEGRVIIATRDFDDVGEIILQEEPALICKQQDYLDFVEQFLDLPVETQVGILDLYYQPLDSLLGQTLIEPSQLLYMLGVLEDLTVIHQLLSIYMTNAHQYRHSKSALSLFGSKFSHSCCPNVGYSSTSSSGLMEYHVLRPIKAKSQATFSYLADLYETPTNERRQLLQQTKSFICQCERCCGFDYLRCIKCPTCSFMIIPCQYIISINNNNNTNNNSSSNLDSADGGASYNDFPYWDCPTCGIIESSHMLQIEQVMSKLLQTIETDIKSKVGKIIEEGNNPNSNILRDNNRRSQFSPQLLQHTVDKCQTSLSLTHHLTIKSLRLLVNVTTNYAYAQTSNLIKRGLLEMPLYKSEIYQLIRSGINAGFQLVLACECVAANCTGCYLEDLVTTTTTTTTNTGDDDVVNNNDNDAGDGATSSQTQQQQQTLSLRIHHDPQYDRSTPMNHFIEDLWQLPLYCWPPLSFAMMERYYPLLKQKFHSNLDSKLKYCISNFYDLTICRECGTTIWSNPTWMD